MLPSSASSAINSGTVKDLKIEATLTSNGNRIGGMTGRNNGTLDGVYFVKGTLTGCEACRRHCGRKQLGYRQLRSVGRQHLVIRARMPAASPGRQHQCKSLRHQLLQLDGSRSFHRGPIPAASSVTVAVTRLPSTAIRQRRPLSPGACTAELSDTSRRATCRTSTAIQRSASLWEERKTPAQCSFGMADAELPEPSRSESDVGQRERTLE